MHRPSHLQMRGQQLETGRQMASSPEWVWSCCPGLGELGPARGSWAEAEALLPGQRKGPRTEVAPSPSEEGRGV